MSSPESLNKGNKEGREREGGGIMKEKVRMIKENEKLLDAGKDKSKFFPTLSRKRRSH